MHILIATTNNAYKNQELEVTVLYDQLRSRRVSVDVLTLPFAMKSATVLAQATAYRLIDVRQPADCLISLSAPTHLLKHPNKVVVVSDYLGLLMDHWDRKYSNKTLAIAIAERNLLHRAESVALNEAKTKLCFSKWTADRLRDFKIDGFKVIKLEHFVECILNLVSRPKRLMGTVERISA